MEIIDAHQHFWDPDDGDYGWLSGPYEPIRRIFTPEDLAPELRNAGVHATVLVQTWSSLEETRRFLKLAEETPFIAGVVGWVDLTRPDVAEIISQLKNGPGGRFLKGIRHQVHDEEDASWLVRDAVMDGLEAVQRAGLVYDLLVRPRELPAALEAVRRLPELSFVVDHIAKPDIREGGFDLWANRLEPFVEERAHVWCKLSGLITEADWDTWTANDLQPYVDEVLEVFRPERCLFGSDWPVCRVAGGYGKWVEALSDCLEGLSRDDRQQIFAGSALDLYHLDLTGALT